MPDTFDAEFQEINTSLVSEMKSKAIAQRIRHLDRQRSGFDWMVLVTTILSFLADCAQRERLDYDDFQALADGVRRPGEARYLAGIHIQCRRALIDSGVRVTPGAVQTVREEIMEEIRTTSREEYEASFNELIAI